MRVRVTAILVALILTVVAGRAQQTPAPAQAPQTGIDTPIFRANVDAVELDAFVVDAEGNPVTDLTVDDFEVLEDGRPQPITSFAVIDIPIERTGAPAESAAIDAPAGGIGGAGVPEGRVTVASGDPPLSGLAHGGERRARRIASRTGRRAGGAPARGAHGDGGFSLG